MPDHNTPPDAMPTGKQASRKTFQQRQQEREAVLEFLLQGVPKLEIRYRLGLSRPALQSHLAALIDDERARKSPSCDYDVFMLTSLAEDIRAFFLKNLGIH